MASMVHVPRTALDCNGVSAVITFPSMKGHGGNKTKSDLVRKWYLALYAEGCIVCRLSPRETYKHQAVLGVLHQQYALGNVHSIAPAEECWANFYSLTVAPGVAAEYVQVSAAGFEAMAARFQEISYGPVVPEGKNVFKLFIQHLNKYGIAIAGNPKGHGNPAKLVWRAADFNKFIPMRIVGQSTKREAHLVLPIDGVAVGATDIHTNDVVAADDDARIAVLPVVCAFDNTLQGLELANWLIAPQTEAYMDWNCGNRVGLKNALLGEPKATALGALAKAMAEPVMAMHEKQMAVVEDGFDEAAGAAEVGDKRASSLEGGSSKKKASATAVDLLMSLSEAK